MKKLIFLKEKLKGCLPYRHYTGLPPDSGSLIKYLYVLFPIIVYSNIFLKTIILDHYYYFKFYFYFFTFHFNRSDKIPFPLPLGPYYSYCTLSHFVLKRSTCPFHIFLHDFFNYIFRQIVVFLNIIIIF